MMHLDAVLEEVARSREALLFVYGLAENDNLLKEEDSPLLHPGQKSSILVWNHEGVLKEQSALSYNFTLKKKKKKKKRDEWIRGDSFKWLICIT